MKPQIRLSSRTRALVVQDSAIFGAAFVSTGVLDGPLSVSALVAAAVVAVKVLVRNLVPAPAKLVAKPAPVVVVDVPPAPVSANVTVVAPPTPPVVTP